MLKKRILASSMASVMALTSMASVAVTAFADGETELTGDYVVDAKGLEAYIKSIKDDPDFKIEEYGSISQEKYKVALQYAEAMAKGVSTKDATVAYQMLKGVKEGLVMHDKAELQALLAQVKPEIDKNNVWSDLDDSQWTADSFDKLNEAYSIAKNAVNKSSKDVNDAWEKLDQAWKRKEEKSAVTKQQFNSCFRDYDAQLKRFGQYESWRRGTVNAEGTNYNGLKTAWGALHNHIKSTYESIQVQYDRLNEVKTLPQSKTYDEEIVKAYNEIQIATKVLKGFEPDDVSATSARQLDSLVEKYKGRILYSSTDGQQAVADLISVLATASLYKTVSDEANVTNAQVFKADKTGDPVSSTTAWWDTADYGGDTIDDSTKANKEDKTVTGSYKKLEKATAIVKIDAPFGLVYIPEANATTLSGLTTGWNVIGIGSSGVYSVKKDNDNGIVTADNATALSFATKGDIDAVVRIFDSAKELGYRGVSFSQTQAKKGIDLTTVVDIPYTGKSSLDGTSTKKDPYISSTKVSGAFSLTASADETKGIYDLTSPHEDCNDYIDTQFGVGKYILKSDNLLEYSTLRTQDQIASESTAVNGTNYGVAPDVSTALNLWNIYRKDGAVVREDNGDTHNGWRETLLGKPGLKEDTRYNTPNDASLAKLTKKRISAEEYGIVYRYMQYAFSDAFDFSTSHKWTYQELDQRSIESYDIFSKTYDAELFAYGHKELDDNRRVAIDAVRQSHPANNYGGKVEPQDVYTNLDNSVKDLEKEYANFNISFGEVYDLIELGARTVAQGTNSNVNSEMVQALAKALAYVDPLLDNEGELVDLENDPFANNNTSFVRYNRVYTYDGDDKAELRRPGGDKLTIGSGKGKDGTASGYNYTHYELTQAYKALQTALANTASVKKGDVNGDGNINAKDAVDVLKYNAGVLKLDDAKLKAGDVNGDSAVNALDAVAILKHNAGVELIK